MIGLVDAFSSSYAQARVKFLEAAATAGLQIESFNHPKLGKAGEVRALDAAFQGVASAKSADKLLVVNSANAAGDSFSGSGLQVFALHDAEWKDKTRAAAVAVLYLHGFDQSLAEAVKKHVASAKKVILMDLSASHSLQAAVCNDLLAAGFSEKCKFSAVKTVAVGSPAWEGQTISQTRQALFKAVDALVKA